MNLITRYLPLSVTGTILWWEKRRLLYNDVMILVGIVSLCICAITIPIFYILIGLGLNVLYTLSWIIEIAIIRQMKSERASQIYAPAFFSSYLILSAISVVAFSFSLLMRHSSP
jgi:hypothetical protein